MNTLTFNHLIVARLLRPGLPLFPLLIPIEQLSCHNDYFLRLGEIVSGAEAEGTPNDWILAALRVGHIARYAPSLRLATIQSFDVITTI